MELEHSWHSGRPYLTILIFAEVTQLLILWIGCKYSFSDKAHAKQASIDQRG